MTALPSSHLMLNYSKVNDPEIDPKNYLKWVAEIHIVDDVKYAGVERTACYSGLADTNNAHGTESWDFILLAEWSDNRLWYMDPSVMNEMPMTDELLLGKPVHEVAEISPTHWNLIQVYDPKKVGYGPHPIFVTWQRLGSSPQDEADFIEWLTMEHLPSVAEIPGFKRARHCKADPRAPWVTEETLAKNLVTYEFADLSGFESSTFKKSIETDWAKRVGSLAKTSELHVYKLVNIAGEW